jgi:murein L,D-transpeptidase YafK
MSFRRTLTAILLLGATVLAGCTASDVLALKDDAPLPADALAYMRTQGMTPSSPIFMRIFKDEGVLEIWKQKDTGRYDLVKSYEICTYSGKKGPKVREGDRQAPEGFYNVSRKLLNPNSSYHLSFDMGYPNAYDRAHGRTGSNLMVHGACSSRGCYSMTDENIAEIYAFAREALTGGRQDAFQLQAFPFRMTAGNLAKHRNSKNFEFWKMLKEGYDHFELTKVPPKVDVCSRRYVFNQQPEEGEFKATASCPPMSMPHNLAVAYRSLQTKEALAFEQAVAKLEGRPIPTQLQSLPSLPISQIPTSE